MIDTTHSAPPELASLHLAKPGAFTDMHGTPVDLSPDLLGQLAASYDPAIYQAPLVIGHPQVNAPAFGHLAKVSVDELGLWGEPINVDPAFAAAVRDARYPNRSLSFWPADHPGSPTPGRPYIRHLGVLGAVPPAIPGLRGADLAADDAAIPVLEFTAFFVPLPLAEDPPMSEIDPVALAAQATALAEQAEALSVREQALADREAAMAAQAAAQRLSQAVAFCDDLASQARLRPGDVPALAELLFRLDADAAAPCFAAADSPEPTAPGPWLRTFLAQLPPLVELSEIATKHRAGAGNPLKTEAEAVRRARAYKTKMAASGQPISFTAACAAVDNNLDQDAE